MLGTTDGGQKLFRTVPPTISLATIKLALLAPSSKPNTKKTTNETLYGTAQGQTNDLQLAADIHLVAKGVGKQVTAIRLAEFLESRGMKVVDCELLTTYENARSLSYKVTIKASDYVKSRDPATWPYRVSVHPYRIRREFGFKQVDREFKRKEPDSRNNRQYNRDNENLSNPSAKLQTINNLQIRGGSTNTSYRDNSMQVANDKRVWLMEPHMSRNSPTPRNNTGYRKF